MRRMKSVSELSRWRAKYKFDFLVLRRRRVVPKDRQARIVGSDARNDGNGET